MRHFEINTSYGILFLVLMLASYISGYPVLKRNKRDADNVLYVTDNAPKVFLTVSSLASHPGQQERLLELNWYDSPAGLNEDDNSRIQLFDCDPSQNCSSNLVSVKPVHHPEGYYRTSVQFPAQVFRPDSLTDACLDFWIAYVYNNEILSSNCLRPRPHWMHDMRGVIGRSSLPELMLAGTHNAGSYAVFDPQADSIFRRYLITQEESVWNQLVYGVRYLDLRVAFQNAADPADSFWITHGHFRTDVTVKSVIEQVKGFLNHTREIVVMDFHRFVNGFSGRRAPQRHAALIAMLEEELGEYMIPVHLSSWVTLNELWDLNKRLYVGYASNKDRRLSSVLFPAIKHLWGDVDRLDDLNEYLNTSVCRRPVQRLNSAMAQLTPTASGAFFDAYGGLRKMAHDVNRHVTRWFREDWRYCANIVSTDYFLGNNMIETTIEVNRDKFGSRM